MGVFEFLAAIFGSILGAVGGILFYKQKKQAKEIENEGALSREWEKLYREQKEISDKNSVKINVLTEKLNLLTIRVEKTEPYICTNISCLNRQNNLKNKKNDGQ